MAMMKVFKSDDFERGYSEIMIRSSPGDLWPFLVALVGALGFGCP